MASSIPQKDKKPTTTFKGMAILCFYPNGLFQGHCINTINNESPYSLAGNKLIDYEDPKHNDCMEPDDFYTVVIRPNARTAPASIVKLTIRRERNNDASGLYTHEHESHINEERQLKFATQQFLAGQKALKVKRKYFMPTAASSHLFSNYKDEDLIVCIGDIEISI